MAVVGCGLYPPAGELSHYEVVLGKPSVSDADHRGDRWSCVRRKDTGRFVQVPPRPRGWCWGVGVSAGGGTPGSTSGFIGCLGVPEALMQM